MRGQYDERLRAFLAEATRTSQCNQTSLAEELKREQSGLSKYLNGTAGAPLDLDSAHLALKHCGGGGLPEFVLATPVPIDERVPPKVLAFLRLNAGFTQLLVDLLDVPRGGQRELLRMFQIFVVERKRVRKGGRKPGPIGGTRTKQG